jgi:hypothetical protein
MPTFYQHGQNKDKRGKEIILRAENLLLFR